jgi:hypothetical protein
MATSVQFAPTKSPDDPQSIWEISSGGEFSLLLSDKLSRHLGMCEQDEEGDDDRELHDESTPEEEFSKIFNLSQLPLCVLIQDSPGERQSSPMNGMTQEVKYLTVKQGQSKIISLYPKTRSFEIRYLMKIKFSRFSYLF